MKFDRNKNYASIAFYAFITIVLSALVIVGGIMNMDFEKLVGILKPFLYAFAFAYLLNKVVGFFLKVINYVYRKIRHSERSIANTRPVKYVSIALSYIVVILAIYGFMSVIVPQLTSSVTDVMNNYQRYISAGTKWFQDFVAKHDFLQNFFVAEELEETIVAIINYLMSLVKEFSPKFLGFLERFANEVKNILFGLFISIYMLVGKERFKAQTKKLLSAFSGTESSKKILDVAAECDARFGGFIVGKIIDSTIIGIICYICCLIFSFPFPALVSFIIGVTNIIPIAGPFIGAIPTGFLILLVDPTKFIWFIIFVFVLQQADGNFIGPKILGDTTGLSAFWVLTSLIIMGGLYGIFGMLIAVPLCSVIYYEIKLLTEKRLSEKELSTRTVDYASPGEYELIAPREKNSAWKLSRLSGLFKKHKK